MGQSNSHPPLSKLDNFKSNVDHASREHNSLLDLVFESDSEKRTTLHRLAETGRSDELKYLLEVLKREGLLSSAILNATCTV